ncbi:hypothetical protein [Actibacterium sp. 188UL27-1]|uniref:hypothetical protein n=1 Tax=Actibacterium sp. 188UL27-1 TaxID=2786961 RepID=UPI00195A2D21|nr:hypothetical protein [Actibacterium sp. 188UL27-1]MBM7067628.1 hypothetical protein [Actibacterium sp. 188UL27-1]
MAETRKTLPLVLAYALSVLVFCAGIIGLLVYMQIFDRVILADGNSWIAPPLLAVALAMVLVPALGLNWIRLRLFERAEPTRPGPKHKTGVAPRARHIDFWLLPLPIGVLFLLHWSAGGVAILAIAGFALYLRTGRRPPKNTTGRALIAAILAVSVGCLHGVILLLDRRMTLGAIVVLAALYSGIAVVLARHPGWSKAK